MHALDNGRRCIGSSVGVEPLPCKHAGMPAKCPQLSRNKLTNYPILPVCVSRMRCQTQHITHILYAKAALRLG